MTFERLTKFSKLIDQINKDADMLESLRLIAGPGAQRITGMPHAQGVSDVAGHLAIEITYLVCHLRQLEQERDKELPVIEEYIGSITDSRVHLAYRLRFVRGMRWKDVATCLGGRNTEDGVKSMCYRYYKLHRFDAL